MYETHIRFFEVYNHSKLIPQEVYIKSMKQPFSKLKNAFQFLYMYPLKLHKN